MNVHVQAFVTNELKSNEELHIVKTAFKYCLKLMNREQIQIQDKNLWYFIW